MLTFICIIFYDANPEQTLIFKTKPNEIKFDKDFILKKMPKNKSEHLSGRAQPADIDFGQSSGLCYISKAMPYHTLVCEHHLGRVLHILQVSAWGKKKIAYMKR